jgi:hypothetical protein
LLRAFVALALGGQGALEARFGDASLTAMSIAMAGLVSAVVYIAWKLGSAPSVQLLVPDVLFLLLLVPTLSIASTIELSDSALGGASEHFLLSALAVLGLLALGALLGAYLAVDQPALAGPSILPGTLAVAAVLGGGERFAVGALHEGLSLAWMAAAGLTLLYSLVVPRLRAVALLSGVLTCIVLLVGTGARESEGTSISASNAAIAYLAIALAGVLVAGAPGLAARLRRYVERPPGAPAPPSF